MISNGNRTSLSATIDGTDDFDNSYTYDALNRLTGVDQTEVSGGNEVAEKRVDFAYNDDSRYDTIARYNDTVGGTGDEIATSTYTYDSLGRLTDLDYEQGGTDLFTPYSWSYDDLGRITDFDGADGTTDYEYDKTNQLTDADHDYQTDEAYSFDANGNRTNTGYTTGDDNRLTNDGTYSYEYDDEGNRTKRTDDSTDEETLYEWDFRNRLTKVTEKDDMGTTTQVVEYTYDVFNRRIAKAVDTSSPFTMADAAIERYVYDDVNGVNSVDGGNVVLDFVDPDGTGSTVIDLERRQLFGNAVDQILAQEDVTESISGADRVYWPLGDHLGTVRDLVKNDGTLGEHYEYDSFGQIMTGDTSVTRYLFTSREFDPDTGLQYNRARWYDAEVGRWITTDPLGFNAGDTNLSRYVGNGPANATDPTGYDDEPIYVPIPPGNPPEHNYAEQRDFFEQMERIISRAPPSSVIRYSDYLGETFGFDPYPECDADGSEGMCGAWTDYIYQSAPTPPANIQILPVNWDYIGSWRPLFTHHNAIRVDYTNYDGSVSSIYYDNGLIGGDDGSFSRAEIGPQFINEFPRPPGSSAIFIPRPTVREPTYNPAPWPYGDGL